MITYFLSILFLLKFIAIEPTRLRDFFDKLAIKKGFSPTEPEKWYNITRDDILSCEVVLFFCRNMVFQ